MNRFLLCVFALVLSACATAEQPATQDANVGEGDKYIVGNIAGLATAKGAPRWSDRSNRGSKTTTYLTYIDADGVVHPVLDPDGKPLMQESTGYSTLVINYGSLTQTVTGSGTTEGESRNSNEPIAEPTNTNPIDVTVPVGP